MDIKALAGLKIADIVEKLDDLTVEQLTELRAIETADSNRVTLIERIDAKLADATKQAVAPAPAKAQAGLEPAWLADDYTGPLTIDQAQARLAKRRAAQEADG
jgi:uncharacterized protein (DUF433 family)